MAEAEAEASMELSHEEMDGMEGFVVVDSYEEENCSKTNEQLEDVSAEESVNEEKSPTGISIFDRVSEEKEELSSVSEEKEELSNVSEEKEELSNVSEEKEDVSSVSEEKAEMSSVSEEIKEMRTARSPTSREKESPTPAPTSQETEKESPTPASTSQENVNESSAPTSQEKECRAPKPSLHGKKKEKPLRSPPHEKKDYNSKKDYKNERNMAKDRYQPGTPAPPKVSKARGKGSSNYAVKTAYNKNSKPSRKDSTTDNKKYRNKDNSRSHRSKGQSESESARHQIEFPKRRDPEKSRRDIERNKQSKKSYDIVKKVESGLIPPGMEFEIDIPDMSPPLKESGRRNLPPRSYGDDYRHPRRSPPRIYDDRKDRHGRRPRSPERFYFNVDKFEMSPPMEMRPQKSRSPWRPPRRPSPCMSRSPRRRDSPRFSPLTRPRSPFRHSRSPKRQKRRSTSRNRSQERFLKALVKCSGVNLANIPENSLHLSPQPHDMPPGPPFGPGMLVSMPPQPFDMPPGPPFIPGMFHPEGPITNVPDIVMVPAPFPPLVSPVFPHGPPIDIIIGNVMAPMPVPPPAEMPPVHNSSFNLNDNLNFSSDSSSGLLKINLIKQQSGDNLLGDWNRTEQHSVPSVGQKKSMDLHDIPLVGQNRITDVRTKCRNAVKLLQKLHYPTKLVHFPQHVVPPTISKVEKPSPLKKQGEPVFKFTSKTSDEGSVLLHSIISTLHLDQAMRREPMKYFGSVHLKDAHTQTYNYECDTCIVKKLITTNSKGVNTMITPKTSVQTQVNENQLASKKGIFVFNKSNSETKEEIVSLTHMTPAQILIAELTAKAKSLQNTPGNVQKPYSTDGHTTAQGYYGSTSQSSTNVQMQYGNQNPAVNAQAMSQGYYGSSGQNFESLNSGASNSNYWNNVADSRNQPAWGRKPQDMNTDTKQFQQQQYGGSIMYNQQMRKKFTDFKRKLN